MSISNVVFNLLTELPYCIYEKHYSSFDLIIKYLDIPIFDTHIKKSGIPIDVKIYNDIYGIEKNTDSNNINALLLHNNSINTNIKKEDKKLLKDNTYQNFKLCFCKNVYEQFIGPKTNYVEYGIPKNINTTQQEKNKHVVILNLKQQKSLNVVYEYLKQNYEISIINDMPASLEHLISYLSEYKIAIIDNVEIDNIVANLSGCHIITTGNIQDKCIGVSNANSMQNILAAINQIDNNYSRISSTAINNIYNKYCFKKFSSSMNDFFSLIKENINNASYN